MIFLESLGYKLSNGINFIQNGSVLIENDALHSVGGGQTRHAPKPVTEVTTPKRIT
jgi:hypothetical protein